MDDLERFMRAFAQFQQRFMEETADRGAPARPDAGAARGRMAPRPERTPRTRPDGAA